MRIARNGQHPSWIIVDEYIFMGVYDLNQLIR